MGNSDPDWRQRTRILFGDKALERLQAARVAVFGLGAVGSYAVEALARSGVGELTLVDFDVFKPSNINRQLYALTSTLGKSKVEVAAARAADINPDISVIPLKAFAHADNLPELLSRHPDLIVDAVDSLNPKVEIIAAGAELGIPVFSALGAATRLDADRICFGPFFSAKGCPLGRHLRKRLRRRGVEGDLWCVYSDEPQNPEAVVQSEESESYQRGRERDVLGSAAAVTGMFGLRLGHEAVLRLAGITP